MNKLSKFFFLLTLVILSAAFFATAVTAADAELPIKVSVASNGVFYDISPTQTNGEWYFFLPGITDTKNLTVKYTGKGTLQGADGKSMTVDASSGSFKVTEVRGGDTKNNYSFKVMTGGSIPSVYITLDNDDKALKKIHASKANEEPGDIAVIDEGGNVMYNGKMKKMTGHGFTSYVTSFSTEVKNSYNFNLSEKAELINGAGDAKKWVLLSPRSWAGDRDTSGLSQIAAFNAFSSIIGNSRASIEGKYVDLYINGEYRGLYILTERMNNGGAIDVEDLDDHITASGKLHTKYNNKKNNGKDPAINAGIVRYTYDQTAKIDASFDITGGYVLEVMCDNYEGCGFETKNGLYISVKSPDYCTKEMMQYISEYVQQFENAIYSRTGYNSEGKHYTEYIDEKSLADLVLVYAHYINFEYFRTSTYIYKDRDGEKNDTLTFGPAWDFETGASFLSNDKTLFGTTNGFTYNVNQQYIWSEQLWQHGDFMELLVAENERLRDVTAQLCEIDSPKTVPSLYGIIESAAPSGEMSSLRWGIPQFENIAKQFAKAANTRFDHWYDELWNPDKYLLSVSIEGKNNDDGTVTLTANVNGKFDGECKWYAVNSKKPSSSSCVQKEGLSYTFVPTEDGVTYYCVVTGPNNAYYAGASGEIFRSKNISMKSGNVTVTPDTFVPETEPPVTEAPETEARNESGCESTVSVVMIALASVFGTALIKKKNIKNK